MTQQQQLAMEREYWNERQGDWLARRSKIGTYTEEDTNSFLEDVYDTFGHDSFELKDAKTMLACKKWRYWRVYLNILVAQGLVTESEGLYCLSHRFSPDEYVPEDGDEWYYSDVDDEFPSEVIDPDVEIQNMINRLIDEQPAINLQDIDDLKRAEPRLGIFNGQVKKVVNFMLGRRI